MRAANRLSGRPLYAWRLYSSDGAPVQASNGIDVMPYEAISESTWPDLVIVCAGLGVQHFNEPRTLTWLRRQARRGTALGAISTGTHLLARARLLDGCRCTIHWENLPGLMEEFPDVHATGSVFEIDRGRLTCSGGTAALDMMLHFIATRHGDEFAARLSSQFIHDRVRTPGDRQLMAEQARLRVKSPRLGKAIYLMEANLETPLPTAEIARRTGVSSRQLERLFLKYRGVSPRRFYLELRLRRARLLLLQTGMSVLAVALASGFVSQSYFTKCYRECFGYTPTGERDRMA